MDLTETSPTSPNSILIVSSISFQAYIKPRKAAALAKKLEATEKERRKVTAPSATVEAGDINKSTDSTMDEGDAVKRKKM